MTNAPEPLNEPLIPNVPLNGAVRLPVMLTLLNETDVPLLVIVVDDVMFIVPAVAAIDDAGLTRMLPATFRLRLIDNAPVTSRAPIVNVVPDPEI